MQSARPTQSSTALIEHTVNDRKSEAQTVRNDAETKHWFENSKHLQNYYLNIQGTYLSVEDIQNIVTFLNKHPEITELNITNCFVDGRRMRLLSTLEFVSCLKINGTALHYQSAEILSKNKSIEAVWLYSPANFEPCRESPESWCCITPSLEACTITEKSTKTLLTEMVNRNATQRKQREASAMACAFLIEATRANQTSAIRDGAAPSLSDVLKFAGVDIKNLNPNLNPKIILNL